ncbi:MAG: sulfotransferase domain-containing protein [bacterium]
MRKISQKVSKEATRFIGLRWGERFPFYYVCEYPKSGGTWLAQMVSDFLQVPFPQHSNFPIGFEAVILNHWAYEPRLRRVFYLYRDGRDVMTSYFFYRLRIASRQSHPGNRRVRKRLVAMFGDDYEKKNRGFLLARFIDNEFRRPGLGSKFNWSRHVSDWYAPDQRSHIAYLSYEDLLRDTRGTLTRVLAQILGRPPDPSRVESTVTKCSMEAQTGRRPGEEDPAHHIRKGVAGDWKNHFNRECAELFHQHGGEALISLGYEQDSSWIDRF